ncbi:putative disease resistance protein RXW24L [Triticum urartu]|nr:putative disease resistance protein RXW24L [Triticum urartu]
MQGATQLMTIAGRLVGEEYQQLRRVGGKVAELSDELDTMNAILRMLSDADESAVDHFIRVWMKQVQELAYDAEDCVHLYIFRIRCRRRDGLLVWSKTKRIVATLFPRRRLARQINALRARAVVISERHARYGVSREALLRITTSSLAAPAPVSGHALGRPAANDPHHLVGITDQANTLADMVKSMSNNERDMKLKVFSIVGFGGLGKTTLAMEVCRHLEADFQRQAQVSVSQAFGGRKDMEGLLKRVLQQIVKPKADNAQGIKEEDPLDGIDTMGVDELTGKLEELLMDTRGAADVSHGCRGRWRRGLHRPFAEIWIHGAAAPASSAPPFALWTVGAGTLPGVLDRPGGGESALGGGSSGAFVLARSGGLLLPPSRSFPFVLVAGGCCWFRCFWGWWFRLGPGETLGRLVWLDSGVGFGRRILPESGVVVLILVTSGPLPGENPKSGLDWAAVAPWASSPPWRRCLGS